MIKVINCKKKNYKRELVSFLDKRRSGKAVDTSIVPKILKDIKIKNIVAYVNNIVVFIIKFGTSILK